MLFTAPAYLSDPRVTIVVVLYQVLIDNLVGWIKDSGINCIDWKYGLTNLVAVVVVSIDIAGELSFLGYTMVLSGKKLLH